MLLKKIKLSPCLPSFQTCLCLFLEPPKTSRRTGPHVNQISSKPLSQYGPSWLDLKCLNNGLRKKNVSAPCLAPFSSSKTQQLIGEPGRKNRVPSKVPAAQVSSDFHPTSETFWANLQRPTTFCCFRKSCPTS